MKCAHAGDVDLETRMGSFKLGSKAADVSDHQWLFGDFIDAG